PTHLSTLSLHDALPILFGRLPRCALWSMSPSRDPHSIRKWMSTRVAGDTIRSQAPTRTVWRDCASPDREHPRSPASGRRARSARSEEHTSELQSLAYLV